ncbi:hypothetical protein L2E82_27828 [Cichorium intybus]|uniref:Uncharacterized protein n=1 Tax=Cichorium intybus TaxID=13427 RepID=A0ACB9CU84_CICIN|nr:hypothetical protein L2E82_27828 [Cichorium intybus]
MKLTPPTLCDLCHQQQPSFYCSSDSAFLCSDCDFQVHTANFLVARHVRLSLCSHCKSFHHTASSSSPSSSSSSSSSCVSSNNCSTKITPVVSDWKTRDVLENWCTRLGVGGGVIEVARHAFESWLAHRWVWPYRVGLAASLWLGLLRFTKDDEKKKIRMRGLLKRLEEITGVPARSIVVAESKLESMLRMMKHRRGQQQQEDVQEGWAEC